MVTEESRVILPQESGFWYDLASYLSEMVHRTPYSKMVWIALHHYLFDPAPNYETLGDWIVYQIRGDRALSPTQLREEVITQENERLIRIVAARINEYQTGVCNADLLWQAITNSDYLTD